MRISATTDATCAVHTIALAPDMGMIASSVDQRVAYAQPAHRGKLVAPPVTSEKIDLITLDLLRGLAALYVLLFHASVMTWENAQHYAAISGQQASPYITLLTTILDFGKPAVLLFFLISGFCIHYRQAAALARGQTRTFGSILNVRVFFVRRLWRLYPPFIFAIALTAVLDAVGAWINPALYAGHTSYWRINLWLYGDHASTTLLGNLLMQSDLMVPPFGTNGALWSLAYEFWFYALYPAFVLLTLRFGPRGALAAVTAIGLLIGLAVRLPPVYLPSWLVVPSWLGGLFLCWIIWCAGAFLAEAYVGRVRLPRLALAALAATAGLVILVVRGTTLAGPLGFQAIGWGVCLTSLLAFFLLAPPAAARRLTEATARHLAFLGTISYSLYLVHMPWLTLVSAWWLSQHDRLPQGLELFGLAVSSALGVGALSWYLIERRCTPRRSSTGV